MKKRLLRIGVFLLLCILTCMYCLIGCRGNAPTGSVSGTVTYNGKPVSSGLVLFVNMKTGIGASAELDTTGAYKVPSLWTGEYQVNLQTLTPSPAEMAEGMQPKIPNVPDKYLDLQTSGLTATVTEGKNSIDFTLH